MTLDEAHHVPLETCRTAYMHGVYQKEDGSSIPVVINKPVQYRYLSHGHITHTASNVFCEGTTLIVNGQEIIKDMLTYLSTQNMVFGPLFYRMITKSCWRKETGIRQTAVALATPRYLTLNLMTSKYQ